MEFSGRTVLVTGASSGIGAAVARRFGSLGAHVAVNSARSVDEGRAVAEQVGGSYHRADVSDERQVLAMIDEIVAATGRLDVVVNNAGTTRVIPHADLAAVTDEVWERILDVNLLGTWYVSRAAVPHLAATADGSIVNITSVAGLHAIGSSIPYAVSKAAINHLTVLMARSLGPGVRVNAVAPGLVDTPWTEEWDDMRARVKSVAPMRRASTPDDVAEAVLGLTRATMVTGEVLSVDGGHLQVRG
jgi:ketoreductase RED2